MRLIYPRRNSATTFVLLAAVVMNVITMAVVTVQAPGFTVNPGGLMLLLAAIGGAAFLRDTKLQAFWPYWLGCGTASWFACYWMGIHPALALIPIVPFLPHDARRRGDVFADRPDPTPVHDSEHRWNGLAQIALFLFGLVNGGVILKHFDTGTWAVLVAALVGRPAGILIAMTMAMNVGLRLPGHMRWTDLVVASLATTSGFTFALFVAATALPIGAVSEQVTVGALSTALGALITVGAAGVLAVGRFKPHQGGRARWRSA
jgi:NhaA family Na+:H+ antiporter